MSAPELDTAVHWLRMALGDVAVGQRLLESDDTPRRAVAEHAQQAAEKALKAILALHGDDPPRSHDIVVLARLVDACEDLPPELTPRGLAALTDAAAARHPEVLEAAYSADEARELLETATRITAWVRDRIVSAGAMPAELTAL